VASARPGPTVTDRSRRPRVIALLVVATALGVVLSAVGGVLLLLDPSGKSSDSSDRNEVTSRANDFAVAYNTYDVVDLADYQKRLKGLLTPAYDKQFVKVTDAVFKALESKSQKSGGANVRGVAVDSIDQDSAVAIVAVDAKITNTDNKAEVLRHFRWKLSFTKTKGEWLISDFESVAPVDAQATPLPSATPSTGATEGGDGE
jgi:Mce-associated membrane protein